MLQKTSIKFKCQYLNDYMEMVEESESPRLFHIWSAVSAISAALGRRCWLPWGFGSIYPNMFVVLVGAPATRKSSAARLGGRLVRQVTGVKFGPTDTGGQRQGIVAVMADQGKNVEELFLRGSRLVDRDNSLAALTMDEIGELTTEPPEDDDSPAPHSMDKHHVMLVASEFTSIVGQANTGMLEFLTAMWDGDTYDYGLKGSRTVLKDPLVGIIGGTTPIMLAGALPAAAGGQGFLSRAILVFGARKYKQVPTPVAPDEEITGRVKDIIASVWSQRHGPFVESNDGRGFRESLYIKPLGISDPRFSHYGERRNDHLIKLAMCLAAANGTDVIGIDEYEEANRILSATEVGMPDALGEFGLSPLAQLKQRLLDTVRDLGVVELGILQAMFHRDARPQDIVEVLMDLNKVNQLSLVKQKSGVISVHSTYNGKDTENEMLSLLS